MRVILIAKSFSKGGAASGARNLRNSLKSAGHEVICLDGYEAQKRNFFLGIFRLLERVVERAFLDAETHFLRLWWPTFDLRALEKKYKPDVIQLCDVSGNTIGFSHIKYVSCPVVHRMSDFWPYKGSAHYSSISSICRGWANWIHRKMIFDGFSWPDMRVAPSQWLADSLLNDSLGSPVVFIPNAVERSGISSGRAPKPGVVVFGFVSNAVLDPRKGFDRLARKLEFFAKNGCAVELKVFGELRESEKKPFQGVSVSYLGRFKSADLACVYGDIDILLCPSRLDNSPNVVTEALAHGCPVIGQAGTGMASYIYSDFGGLVDFDDLSPEGMSLFSGLVTRLLETHADCSESALSFVANELSPAVIGKKYTSLYSTLRQ